VKSYFCHCGHEVVAEKTPNPIRWKDGHVCRFGDTPFSRYAEQCLHCECFYENCEGEVKAQMDEVGIECSLEQIMNSNEACNFFQRGD
jgi:hypothetical protein